jgi:ankyrin repeat protein
MKKLMTLVTLLLWISASLAAQASEPEQTPDVINDTETNDAPEATRVVIPQPASGPLSSKEKALIQSAYDGKLAEVEVLVAKGVSVNLADKKKRTPLMLAAYNGHTSVVEFLYGKGADINAKDSGGQTALFYTSKRSFNETTEFLLKNGAEVNVQSKKKGITALMIAAALGNVKMVRLLLDNGADPALHDNFGATAEVIAQKKGHTAVVDLLAIPPAPADGQ